MQSIQHIQIQGSNLLFVQEDKVHSISLENGTIDFLLDEIPYPQFKILDKMIVWEGFKIFDIHKKEWILKMDDSFYFEQVLKWKDNFICSKIKESDGSIEFYSFNPNSLNYNLLPTNFDSLIPRVVHKDLIIANNANTVSVFNEHHEKLWEKDFSQKGHYEDIASASWQDGQIEWVLAHQQLILLLKGDGLFALDLYTGKEIWTKEKTSLEYFTSYQIIGDTILLSANISFVFIDIRTGDETSSRIQLQDLETKQNESILPIGRKMVFHNGFIWHVVSNYGYNYLLKISPETGGYLEKIPIDYMGIIETPIFYKEKIILYAQDQKNLRIMNLDTGYTNALS